MIILACLVQIGPQRPKHSVPFIAKVRADA